MELDVVDRIPDPQPSDVRLPLLCSSDSLQGMAKILEASACLQTSEALQGLSLISSDTRFTAQQCNLARQIEEDLFMQVKTLTERTFGRLKDRIANRKVYVLFEEKLHCNTKTDHLIPKNILPLFEEYIDLASESLYSHVYTLVHVATKSLLDASQKQEPLPKNRITELESLVYQLRLQLDQIQQDYAMATDRFAEEQANSVNELTRLREQLWQKNKYNIEYEADFNPYITPSRWGTLSLLAGGTSGIEDRKVILTKLLDDEREKCAELRNKLSKLEIQLYSRNQQVDLLPSLYDEIDTLKQKLAEYEELLQTKEETRNLELSMFQAKEEALKEELVRLQSRLSQSSDIARSSQAAVVELTKRLSEKNLSIPISAISQTRAHNALDDTDNPFDNTREIKANEETIGWTMLGSPHSSKESIPTNHRHKSSIEDIGVHIQSDNLSISSINISSKSSRATSRERRISTKEYHKVKSKTNKREISMKHKEQTKKPTEDASKGRASILSKAIAKKPDPKSQITNTAHDSLDDKNILDDPFMLTGDASRTELEALRKQLDDLMQKNDMLQAENKNLQNVCAQLELNQQTEPTFTGGDLHSSKQDTSCTNDCQKHAATSVRQEKDEEKVKAPKNHFKKKHTSKRITALLLTKERFTEFKEEVDNDDTLIPKVDYRPISSTPLAPETVYDIIGSVSAQPSVLAHGEFLRSMDYRILEHTINCVEGIIGKKFRDEISLDGTCTEYICLSGSCSDSRFNDFDDLDLDVDSVKNKSPCKANYSPQPTKGRTSRFQKSPSSPMSTLREEIRTAIDNIPDSLLSYPNDTWANKCKNEHQPVTYASGTITDQSLRLQLYSDYINIPPLELSDRQLSFLLEMDAHKKEEIRKIINQLLFHNLDINITDTGTAPLPILLEPGLLDTDNRVEASLSYDNYDAISKENSQSQSNEHQCMHESDNLQVHHNSASQAMGFEEDNHKENQSEPQDDQPATRKIYQSGMLRVLANAKETVRDILPKKPILIAPNSILEKSLTRSRHRQDYQQFTQKDPVGFQNSRSSQSQRPQIVHIIKSSLLRLGIESLLTDKGFHLSESSLTDVNGTVLVPITASTKVEVQGNGNVLIGNHMVGNLGELRSNENVTDFYNALVDMNIVAKLPLQDTSGKPENEDLTTSMLSDRGPFDTSSSFVLKNMYSRATVQILTDPREEEPVDTENTIQMASFGSLHVRSLSPHTTGDDDLFWLIQSIKHKPKSDIHGALNDIATILQMLGFSPDIFTIRVATGTNLQKSRSKHTSNPSNETQITKTLQALSKEDKLSLLLDAVLVKQITWNDIQAIFKKASPIVDHIMEIRNNVSVSSSKVQKPSPDDIIEESDCITELSNLLVASQLANKVASGDSTETLNRISHLDSDQQDLINAIIKTLQQTQQENLQAVTPNSQDKLSKEAISQVMKELTNINEDAIVKVLLRYMQINQKSMQFPAKLFDVRDLACGTDDEYIDVTMTATQNSNVLFTEEEWQELERSVPQDTLKFIKDKLQLQIAMQDELRVLKEQIYISQAAQQAAQLSYEKQLEEEQYYQNVTKSTSTICSMCGQEILPDARVPTQELCSARRLPSHSGVSGEVIQLDTIQQSNLSADHLRTDQKFSIAHQDVVPNEYAMDSLLHCTISQPVTAPDTANAAVTTLITGSRSRYAEKLPIMGFGGTQLKKYNSTIVKSLERAQDLQDELGLQTIPRKHYEYPINQRYNRMGIPFAFVKRTPHIDDTDGPKILDMKIDLTKPSKFGFSHATCLMAIPDRMNSFLHKQLSLSQDEYNSNQHKIRSQRASDAAREVIKHYTNTFQLNTKLNWSMDDDPRNVFIRLYENARELREKYEQRFQVKALLEAELFSRYKQAHIYTTNSGIHSFGRRDMLCHELKHEGTFFTPDISVNSHTPHATYLGLGNDSISLEKTHFMDVHIPAHEHFFSAGPKIASQLDKTNSLPIISPRLLLSNISSTPTMKTEPITKSYCPEYERYTKQAHVSGFPRDSINFSKILQAENHTKTPDDVVHESENISRSLLQSGLQNNAISHENANKLYISGIHMDSKSVHNYDTNASGRLSIQARIHSEIDDLRLDELSKNTSSLNESGNPAAPLGSTIVKIGRVGSRLLGQPLKQLHTSTNLQEPDEPSNLKVVSITNIGVDQRIKPLNGKEGMLAGREMLTISSRSGSVRRSVALAFKEVDSRIEEKLLSHSSSKP